MKSAASYEPKIANGVLTFIDALGRAKHVSDPYDYWLLDNILPQAIIDKILELPIEPMADPVFKGRRENNNGARCHFSAEKQATYPVCREVVSAFGDLQSISAIKDLTGADLSQGQLRVEYCQDRDGFWLEPHLDVGAKLFTMMLYLSKDPDLYDAGTDIYDSSPMHNLVASAPYASNAGMIFIPGQHTWHGLSKRPIHGVRKSLMINFVSQEWRNREELAYQ